MKKSTRTIYRSFILPGIFSIAMGMLEAIVVVYLRRIYYPEGFTFPVKFLTPDMLSTECIREISTIVMLLIVGIMSGKDNLQRFLYFLYCFAIWDIIYYAALKIFINWPESFYTTDILFLLPVPWIGPVLAPLICSTTMIGMSVVFIRLKDSYSRFKIKLKQWGFILLGATLIFVSFILDYFELLVQSEYSITECTKRFAGFVPKHFYWLVFGIGELSILYGIGSVIYRTRKKRSKPTYAKGGNRL